VKITNHKALRCVFFSILRSIFCTSIKHVPGKTQTVSQTQIIQWGTIMAQGSCDITFFPCWIYNRPIYFIQLPFSCLVVYLSAIYWMKSIENNYKIKSFFLLNVLLNKYNTFVQISFSIHTKFYSFSLITLDYFVMGGGLHYFPRIQW
jgi:hypothetical protein